MVVGSHVGLTTARSRPSSGLREFELDVNALDPDGVGAQVRDALADDDVLVYTSRTLKDGGLETAREVSRAVTRVVAPALDAEPGWVIAKGGITSHDVAVHGLGIRRAEVLGQLLPGMISVFRPTEADPRAVGMPYVVFAGNVGDEQTLAEIVDRFARLMLATRDIRAAARPRRRRDHDLHAGVDGGDRHGRRAPAATRAALGGRELLRRGRPRAARRRRAGRGARRQRSKSASTSTTAATRTRSTPASRSATAR